MIFNLIDAKFYLNNVAVVQDKLVRQKKKDPQIGSQRQCAGWGMQHTGKTEANTRKRQLLAGQNSVVCTYVPRGESFIGYNLCVLSAVIFTRKHHGSSIIRLGGKSSGKSTESCCMGCYYCYYSHPTCTDCFITNIQRFELFLRHRRSRNDFIKDIHKMY